MIRSKKIIRKFYESAKVDQDSPSILAPSEMRRYLTQYTSSGGVFQPVSETQMKLPPGVYKVGQNMQGIYYQRYYLNTDKLLKFKDERYEKVLKEVDDFWKKKRIYHEMGYTHKRGILLHGVPGAGKSCLLKLVMEDSVKRDNVVFICEAEKANTLITGVRSFHEVEPERPILVILEDLDEGLRYCEKTLLNLFDGDAQIDGVLYLATTNHLESFSPRMIRPGRFDRRVLIGLPPEEGRFAYLTHKLGVVEDSKDIRKIAGKTEGFSFADLRELVVSVYCLEGDIEEVIQRLKKGLVKQSEKSSKGYKK